MSRRILLVESEATLAEITAFRLELLGYEVLRAASRDEALALSEGEPPALVMVDLLLAGEDGLRRAERLSNDPRTTSIPVLAVSSTAELETVQRAFAAGVKDYLVTPYDPAVLEQKLDKWLPVND